MLATAGAMLAVAAPTAGAATETVTNGPVTATFRYTKTDELTFEDLHLKIVRAGVVGLDVPIASRACELGCWPGAELFEDGRSIKATDLDGDGSPEFRSADGRFAYALSSYAGSGVPVQIWRFQHGDLEDVTSEFPALIRADSRHWWKVYRANIRKRPPLNDAGLGALAAWAGDEYRLGRAVKVQRELKLGLRRGWLDGYFGSGRRAVRDLNRLLRQTGYR